MADGTDPERQPSSRRLRQAAPCTEAFTLLLGAGEQLVFVGTHKASGMCLVHCRSGIRRQLSGTPAEARSSRMAKYISFTRFSFDATYSVLTGLPPAPVCFVTCFAGTTEGPQCPDSSAVSGTVRRRWTHRHMHQSDVAASMCK